jgi:4-diphosphocytidyl-2-C-methyl-D-erythritol kinase
MKPNRLHYRSSAKVNLTLDILGILPNGYHELSSIIHTVGLFDDLTFDFGRPLELLCDAIELQREDNLCLRAAALYREAAGLSTEVCSARIALQKNIPAGAGLGGGSGNAAVTLRAFNNYYQALNEPRLQELAARLGADVPLFLSGGCQLMEGIGERLSPLPPLEGWLLIAQPPQPSPTAVVYRAWDQLSGEGATAPVFRTKNVLEKWGVGGVDCYPQNDFLPVLAANLHNDLVAAAEFSGIPVRPLVEALRNSGALGASMTGSGSAAFALFSSKAAAMQGERKLRALASRGDAGFTLQHAFVAPFCQEAITESASEFL